MSSVQRPFCPNCPDVMMGDFTKIEKRSPTEILVGDYFNVWSTHSPSSTQTNEIRIVPRNFCLASFKWAQTRACGFPLMELYLRSKKGQWILRSLVLGNGYCDSHYNRNDDDDKDCNNVSRVLP